MTNSALEKKLEQIVDCGLYTSVHNLRFYVESQLFKDIDLEGKRVLDVGGGTGLFSFVAAAKGAKEVLCLEPEAEGGTSGVIELFNKSKKTLGYGDEVRIEERKFQDLDPETERFDIVLLHNSINHLNERACISIHKNAESRATYASLLDDLYRVTAPHGRLIACDCSRRNFLGDLGIRHPLAPTIEWEKHQTPEIWLELLTSAGFKMVSLDWKSYNSLGSLGKSLLGNRTAAYFFSSHFRLVVSRAASHSAPFDA